MSSPLFPAYGSVPPASPTQVWQRTLRQLAWLAALALSFLWLEYFTPLDDRLSSLFYDPVLRAFPLENNVWLEWLNHRLFKYAVTATALWLLASGLRRRETRRWLTGLAMAVGTTTVSVLKATSAHSCPWEIQGYGGSAEHFRTFSLIPANPGPGHCFPGGHASAGFALMALYFYWQYSHPQRARLALWGGMAAGMLSGMGQVVRGAHFLSHNLWSGWVVALVCVLLFAGFDAWQSRKPAR